MVLLGYLLSKKNKKKQWQPFQKKKIKKKEKYITGAGKQ